RGTPRRLAALVRGLDARQEDRRLEARGPAAEIAFDPQGQPTRAGLGFARSKGVDVSELQIRDIGGRNYAVAVTLEEGRGASAVLAGILPDVIAGLRFSRSMRWNASGVAFSRPLRWFVALLEDQVVPFAYAGVRSGRVTRGIRSQDSPEIQVPSAADYDSLMQTAGILLATEAREASILEQSRALVAQVQGTVVEDPELVREVAHLVEYPLAILGSFDEAYLELPEMVLMAVMRKHQRYLPVLRHGEMLPYFVAIANGAGLDVDAVRLGNQEVLRARYADAAYFYAADTKRSLQAFTPRLSTLMFQERLGSMLDKVERLKRLVPDLGEMLGLDETELATARRAAALCKSDLATQLVVELTSLQGQMGRHYAELSGETPEVAQAIEEHYLPGFMGDRLPESLPGTVLGLADRLDTLVGLFAVGIRPRGAADPWGLRRAAFGLVQLLVEKGLSLALPEALSLAAEVLPVEANGQVLGEVYEYVLRRYRGYLLDRGYRYDLVDAVLNERGYDPYLAYETLNALTRWVARDDWQELLDSYARCVRITRDQAGVHPIQPDRFVEPAALSLYGAYTKARQRVQETQTLDSLMMAVEQLKPAVTRFFDDVLVMDQDPALRNNRLALLQSIGALAEGIVDLTVMEGF
ncbi:MAG: glycine--tRNA ligase subunit beta, partial [Anaerolineae bacterium]|nr:glycine--tRNA ligase subunit beta [Anaerolineae bacterium]